MLRQLLSNLQSLLDEELLLSYPPLLQDDELLSDDQLLSEEDDHALPLSVPPVLHDDELLSDDQLLSEEDDHALPLSVPPVLQDDEQLLESEQTLSECNEYEVLAFCLFFKNQHMLFPSCCIYRSNKKSTFPFLLFNIIGCFVNKKMPVARLLARTQPRLMNAVAHDGRVCVTIPDAYYLKRREECLSLLSFPASSCSPPR